MSQNKVVREGEGRRCPVSESLKTTQILECPDNAITDKATEQGPRESRWVAGWLGGRKGEAENYRKDEEMRGQREREGNEE